MKPITTASQRAMFAFICLVWGTTWLAMKIGIASVTPGVFAGLRWSVAGAILLAFRRLQGQKILPPPRLIPRLLLVSVLLITLNQVIQLYALEQVTAGLAAVISSALTPIALLIFAVATGQERFNPRQFAAVLVGIAGVAMLFGPKAIAGTLDGWQVAGAAGITTGCLCYCCGSVMTRPIMRTLEPVQLAGLTDLTGGLILLVASLAVEPGAGQSIQFHWGWPAFLAWLYLLVPGSVLSTTMYFLLVRDWGPSRPGTYAFIAPVIAVGTGCGFFNETLDWGDAAGMLLMLGGAGLALRPAGAAANMRPSGAAIDPRPPGAAIDPRPPGDGVTPRPALAPKRARLPSTV